MVRLLKEDLEAVMNIWLHENIRVHSYVDSVYWVSNVSYVKGLISQADTAVFEEDGVIKGFIGIDDDDSKIEGIFVSEAYEKMGIGKQLINYAKDNYDRLTLNVFKKNKDAIRFYKTCDFTIWDENTNYDLDLDEFVMLWEKE